MPNKPPRQIDIEINGTTYVIDDGEYSGAELKAIGGVPPGETLFQKHGNGKEVRIEDTEVIKVHPNMVFESGPDGGVS